MQPSGRLAVALGLAVSLGLAVTGCGPKQKFCPDAGDGVCHAPVDSGPVDTYEAPVDKSSMYFGADGGAGTD